LRRGLLLRSATTGGLSDGGNAGRIPRQIHKYSALFVLICSPRAAMAAMAAMRSLSIAGLAFGIEQVSVGQFRKLSFALRGGFSGGWTN
jgi:hypothetical protein